MRVEVAISARNVIRGGPAFPGPETIQTSGDVLAVFVFSAECAAQLSAIKVCYTL